MAYHWRSAAEDLEPFTQARSLPAYMYTSAAIAEAERVNIFAREWVAVGAAARVATPGAYFTTVVAGEPVVLVRDDEGALRAFANVCMHRGTLLCTGSGRTDEFVCPNHGWRYQLDGTLVDAPWFDRVAGFERNEAHLAAVRVACWGGMVFVNLQPDAPAFDRVIAKAPSELSAYRLDELHCTRSKSYDVPGNWKLLVENLAEAYHIPYVHGSLESKLPLESFVYNEFDPPWSSWYYDQPDDEVAVLGERGRRPPIDGLDDVSRHRMRFYRVFPNLQFLCSPDHVIALHVHERAVDTCTLVADFLFPHHDADADDVYAATDKALGEEDAWIIGRVQAGLASSGFESGRLAVPFEKNVIDFHELVLQCLDRGATNGGR